MPDQKLNTRLKLVILASIIVVTIDFHYGLIWEKSHRLSMVGQIGTGVALEIKNPLALIKGSTEILTDDKNQKI